MLPPPVDVCVFIMRSPCHLLPYVPGLMLWGAGGSADVMFTDLGFHFSTGRGSRPLFRHSCRGWMESPCFYQVYKCRGAIGSLTLPLLEFILKGDVGEDKGSKNKGIKDSECRCHCLPCYRASLAPGTGLQEVSSVPSLLDST